MKKVFVEQPLASPWSAKYLFCNAIMCTACGEGYRVTCPGDALLFGCTALRMHCPKDALPCSQMKILNRAHDWM